MVNRFTEFTISHRNGFVNIQKLHFLGKTVTDVVIQPNELSGESDSDKQSEFDINCKIDGKIANIEMQGENDKQAYGKRAEYHAAHVLNHYTQKGMDWDKIPQVFQISVLNFIFDKDAKKSVNQDELNWYHETRYWMHVSDEVTMINAAKREGLAEGRAEGEQIGIAKGEHKKAVEAAITLIKKYNVTPEVASADMGVSLDDVLQAMKTK